MSSSGFIWKKAGAGKSVEIQRGGRNTNVSVICTLKAASCLITPDGRYRSASQGADGFVLCSQDIDGFVWSKTSRGCQLTVKRTSGPVTQFLGFIDKVGCHLRMSCSISAHCFMWNEVTAAPSAQDLSNLRETASAMNKEIEVGAGCAG